jgi:hypothetical protein
MATGRRFHRGQAVNDEIVTTLDEFAAPYGRKITLESVEHESGLRMLRIRIREGHRFTVMDIDTDTAVHWSAVMRKWATETPH